MKFFILFLKLIAGFIFAVVFVCIALLVNGLYRTYGPCVKLPNGVIVAREAYINFKGYYFTPNVVVKGPDGTIFSRGNDGHFYFSETTAWWVDLHPGNPHIPEDKTQIRKNKREGLAYRPDVGLVSAWNNRSLYEQLKRESGPLLEEGKKLRNTNVLGVLTFLIDDPKYYSRDCDVPLFTFEKSYP